MDSTRGRPASAAERRNNAGSTTPSRANSTQAGRYEGHAENGSFIPASETNGDHKNVSERRKERTTVTTTEKLTRRSPVKDSMSAGNRVSTDRYGRASPTLLRRQKESRPESWNPSSKLIAPTTAPLAARIAPTLISADAPTVLHADSMTGMTMPEQESSILDDLLFVFMGCEGQYITFTDEYRPSEEKQRLQGPSFKIADGLDPSLRDLTNSMLKMATHYSAIDALIEVQSKEEFGSVNHALCAAIRRVLKDYLILIAQLESKIVTDPGFTLHQMHLAIIPTAQSLAQVYNLGQDLLRRNSLLEEDIDDSFEDDFNADNILERLREGGDLLPGSMSKKRCIGGNVLGLLTQRLSTYAGDPATRTLLAMLLREASRPYVAMLNEWLHHGGIKDPHSEFLIGERASIKRERLDEDYTDEYWEKRYYIRDKEVPPQLETVKERILLAGKYLNVVRECGGVNIIGGIDDQSPKTFEDPSLLDNINNAYAFANKELLNLLLTKNSLRSRLRSIKHYFFLDRAEFFLYFLELSASELRKAQKNVNTAKLQSLLDLVLYQPGSIAVADPFKEDVKVRMNEVDLTQWLMKIVNVQGIDQDNPDSLMGRYQTPVATTTNKEDDKDIDGFAALELDYSVPFPLSLIISRKTVLRYQLIFRYTLALRHLESMLVECWTEHTKVKSWTHKSSEPRIEMWKRRAWTLRSRMLVFVQQMLFYATAEVMEPNWRKLMAKVDDAQMPDDTSEQQPSTRARKTKRTVDELMQDHVDMLDSCMKDLGLTQSKLLRIHSKLVTGCSTFAIYTANVSRSLYSADPDLTSAQLPEKIPHSRQVSSSSTVAEADPNRITRMEDTLKRYEEHFNRHLKILIDSLNYFAATETVVLLGLCARLTNAEVQKRDEFLV